MFRIFILVGLVAVTSACAQPAYVHHAGEFNRNDPNFGKDPTTIKGVTICYSSRGSTPPDVLALAHAECRKFGKTALFVEQNYANCPLPTPVSAYFSCLGDGNVGGQSNGIAAGKTDDRHTINYDGILFSY